MCLCSLTRAKRVTCYVGKLKYAHSIDNIGFNVNRISITRHCFRHSQTVPFKIEQYTTIEQREITFLLHGILIDGQIYEQRLNIVRTQKYLRIMESYGSQQKTKKFFALLRIHCEHTSNFRCERISAYKFQFFCHSTIEEMLQEISRNGPPTIK